MQVCLKPQDLLVVLKLVSLEGRTLSYADLASEVGLSASEVHSSIRRAGAAGLVSLTGGRAAVIREALREFLLHGARYAFPATCGGIARGFPTAQAAPPLDIRFTPGGEPPFVWPDPAGEARGIALHPLYSAAPGAARRDPVLYEYLALFDALRGGAPAAQRAAFQELGRRLAEADASLEKRAAEPVAAYGAEPAGGARPRNKLHIPRARIAELCRKHHIRRLSLFGSAARNEMTPGSDVDLLVEFEPGHAPSLWDLPMLQDEFSAAFGGRKVDIATPEVLENPYRRRRILPELRTLYAA